MPAANFEQTEHHAKQWSKRLQRAVDKRFDQKPPEDCTQEELLGFYHAAKTTFILAATFALLEFEALEDDQERQQIHDSIAKGVQEAIDKWMRTMPKELRTVRFPGEK